MAQENLPVAEFQRSLDVVVLLQSVRPAPLIEVAATCALAALRAASRSTLGPQARGGLGFGGRLATAATGGAWDMGGRITGFGGAETGGGSEAGEGTGDCSI